MTSKISFNKLLKENIRHRGWLAVLSCILLFLSGPVYAMLMLESLLKSNDSSNVTQAQQLFPGMLNGGTFLLGILIFLLAVLCAVTGFSYLHSAEKIDFYHSFPLSRSQWFRISYTGGLLIFLAPYLASGICTLMIGSVKGILTSGLFLDSCIALAGGILGFLVIYHTAIFAMMLTGKIVTGVLATLVLSIYGNMVVGLIYDLAAAFFVTYSSDSHVLPAQFSGFLSPFALYTGLLGRTAMGTTEAGSFPVIGSSYIMHRFTYRMIGEDLLPLLLFTVIFLLMLGLISDYLYRKRPSEAAGNALAYPVTAPFIKVLISVPTALYCGLFIHTLFDTDRIWMIFICILSVILLCGTIEFIYHMDLHRLLAGIGSSLISIFGVIVILCIMQLDLFGYDTWLPKEDSLESISFSPSSFYGYFSYTGDLLYSETPEQLDSEAMQVKDFTPLYTLAQEGIANTKAGVSPKTLYEMDPDSDYIQISFRFEKKSGKAIYRNYAVSKEQTMNTLVSLCQDENYRKALFPVFSLDYSEIVNIRLTDIYDQPLSLNLNPEQRNTLLDAYKKDVLAVDMRDLQNKSPIGELSIDIPSSDDWSSYDSSITISQFYLYDSYQNSLALLEEFGYAPRTQLQSEDVEKIVVTEAIYTETENADTGFVTPVSNEYAVTDSDEIEEILSQIQFSPYRLLDENMITTRSAEITLKGVEGAIYYPLP